MQVFNWMYELSTKQKNKLAKLFTLNFFHILSTTKGCFVIAVNYITFESLVVSIIQR